MRKQKPRATESTWTTNDEVRRNAGLSNIKRDGKIKDINIALYDVDYAIKWHIENAIVPTIMEENSVVTVPIVFASGEKWAAVQKHGYLRDNQGKLLTPLIVIKRNSVTKREDIQDLKVLETPDARITFEKKYSKNNRYDRFSLSQNSPEKEYYSMDVPKFVQIEYDLLVWTNNTVQLNEVVEQLIWFDGKAFGDSYKFITHIDPPSFEAVNATGEDRIVRATMSMRTKAHILNTHGPNAPALYRFNPITRVTIGLETDLGIETISTGPSQTTTTNVLQPGFANTVPPSAGASVNAALTYLNANTQLTGTYVSSTTVTFSSGWLVAPAGLTATSVNNFMFYANGALIESSSIVSFTESSGVSTLIIDEAQLGYGFSATDEIIAIGKFS